MSDVDLLRRAGELLYGINWQRALARGLGPLHPDGPRPAINDRTVRRWAAGDSAVPAWAWRAISQLLVRERRQLGVVGRSLSFVARQARERAGIF